jgi:hypothetical protein
MSHADQPANNDPANHDFAALIAESQALREDVHTAEAARKRQVTTQTRQNRISTAILFVLLVFVIMALVIAWQGNRTIAQTRETNQRMVDCTAPGGRCYEEGKARTGSAINAILRADVFVSECSRLRPGESGPAFDQFLEACVGQRLAAAAAADPLPAPSATSSAPSTAPTHP